MSSARWLTSLGSSNSRDRRSITTSRRNKKFLAKSRSTRRKVLDEFHEVVRPLLRSGKTIDIISHSWGTVVALEGLFQLQDEGLRGNVDNLFTVGSALSIRPVQRRLKFGAESGRKPRLVSHWTNIDAEGDIVGGTLKGFPFDVDDEQLSLPPVGCSSSWFGVSASCAHSSYFNDANLRVNREIFASKIG